MKDFAKSIYVGNSNKAEIIEKKKKEGATLKVDNGQKLEFSDGSTYVKTSFSEDYREAHNYTGNTRTGNSYNWEERRGHQELYDPTVPFGGHVRGYVEKTKNGYVGAKTNGSIIIAKKEFATEAEAKKFVENKQTGNSKVGNADIYSGNYIIMGDDGDVWFRDEHEDVSIKYIDSWAQKKIAEYQRSIDEIKKGVQEAKQQAKKYGLL